MDVRGKALASKPDDDFRPCRDHGSRGWDLLAGEAAADGLDAQSYGVGALDDLAKTCSAKGWDCYLPACSHEDGTVVLRPVLWRL